MILLSVLLHEKNALPEMLQSFVYSVHYLLFWPKFGRLIFIFRSTFVVIVVGQSANIYFFVSLSFCLINAVWSSFGSRV